MKYILIILIAFVALISSSFQKTDDIIEWSSDKKLDYQDFHAAPLVNAKETAISNCGINYSVAFISDTAMIKIFALFKKDSSWIKEKSEMILSHEQGHFNICERSARILRQQVLSYTGRITKKNVDYLIMTLLKEIRESNFHNQSIYESSVNDAAIQLYWNKTIKHDLDSLQNYSIALLKIKLL